MKSILFGVSVLAGAAVFNAAVANPLLQEPRYYRTADEARTRMPEPQAECLDAMGANKCVAALLAVDVRFDGELSLGWEPVWIAAGTETVCIDSGTAYFRVDCDAPDAVVSTPLPQICAFNPDGTRRSCSGRERPYRPTSTP
ncbi:hypothetical protein [Brevundimonas poindexterae]|uniref:hypothetical protein n=1 Tax=Brevundimonas poindexterae TaxID=74325 RepID=UPI001CFCE773|nr:hypothetical protein [Brevundimonas poindexterae]